MSNEHLHPLIRTILRAFSPPEEAPFALLMTHPDGTQSIKEFQDWLSCDRAFFFWSRVGYRVKWIRGPRDGAPIA